ncbi:MAG TPA: hypothetical protein VLX68_08365 [Chitinivibrionales bacterium]|nr:hypothetical protein [Chitinivibrionales bacterium]
MIKKAVGVLFLALLSGCYTQFAAIPRNVAYVSPPDTSGENDSMQSRLQDTLRTSNDQVCYWTRDLTGQPVLRCYDTYYGRDWYRYNNYPWWSASDPYFYGSYNYYGWDQQCPAYYYYDYSCGACRYYRDYNGTARSWWWNSPGYSGPSPSGSSTPSRARRARSSAVPGPGSHAPSGAMKRPAGNTSSTGSETGIIEKSGSSSTTAPDRRTRGDAVPAATESSGSTDMSKQDQQQPAQQQPADATPQQGTDRGNQTGQSGQNQSSDNNQRDHRNPRSW